MVPLFIHRQMSLTEIVDIEAKPTGQTGAVLPGDLRSQTTTAVGAAQAVNLGRYLGERLLHESINSSLSPIKGMFQELPEAGVLLLQLSGTRPDVLQVGDQWSLHVPLRSGIRRHAAIFLLAGTERPPEEDGPAILPHRHHSERNQ